MAVAFSRLRPITKTPTKAVRFGWLHIPAVKCRVVNLNTYDFVLDTAADSNTALLALLGRSITSGLSANDHETRSR